MEAVGTDLLRFLQVRERLVVFVAHIFQRSLVALDDRLKEDDSLLYLGVFVEDSRGRQIDYFLIVDVTHVLQILDRDLLAVHRVTHLIELPLKNHHLVVLFVAHLFEFQVQPLVLVLKCGNLGPLWQHIDLSLTFQILPQQAIVLLVSVQLLLQVLDLGSHVVELLLLPHDRSLVTLHCLSQIRGLGRINNLPILRHHILHISVVLDQSKQSLDASDTLLYIFSLRGAQVATVR